MRSGRPRACQRCTVVPELVGQLVLDGVHRLGVISVEEPEVEAPVWVPLADVIDSTALVLRDGSIDEDEGVACEPPHGPCKFLPLLVSLVRTC